MSKKKALKERKKRKQVQRSKSRLEKADTAGLPEHLSHLSPPWQDFYRQVIEQVDKY